MRCCLVLFAVMAVGCATDPAIVGPSVGRASPEDIRQIREIASRAPEGWAREWARLWSIWFDAPDQATVTLHDAHFSVWFTVHKSGTRWALVSSSLIGTSPVNQRLDNAGTRQEIPLVSR
jgi:hypothetical protein